MKRKFSFNELLYDERYEKNLIEKVVVWSAKKKQSKESIINSTVFRRVKKKGALEKFL